MSEENIIPEEPVTVDLDANPSDGSLAKSDPAVPAVEPEAVEPAEPAVEAVKEEPAVEAEGEVAQEEPEAKADVELDKAAWGDTGSDVGNSVLGMLQDSGIEVADAKALLFDAVQSGDLSKIDIDALTAKVGKNAATIIMSGTKTYIAEVAGKNEAIIADVHTAAGGKDNWEAASQWAASSIPEATLAEYRPMIDKGGAAARFAVSEILAAYNKDGNNSTLAPVAPRAEPTTVSAPASTATTRAEYVAALNLAHKRNASPREIAAIQANRNSGRQQGI